jgi:hypothetical protein
MNRSGTGRDARRVAMIIAIATTALLLQTAVATAKGKPKPPKNGADLIITHLLLDAGATPDYVVVGTDGTFSDFSVDVTVKNAGNRPAARSHLKIWINQAPLSSHHIAVGYAVIPRLAPHQHHAITFDVSGLKFNHVNLTPIFAVAKANYNLVVPEIHYTNNTRYGKQVPVIAREWKVTSWSTHSNETVMSPNGSLTLDNTDDALPGFIWKFSGFDSANQIFTYQAYGGINQDTKLSSPVCSGSGVGTANGPWSQPDTQFSIDYAVDLYGASLYTKNEKPYSVPYTCKPTGSGTMSVNFLDLETYGTGPPPQRYPYGARRLSGSGKLVKGFATLNFTWQFDADVP